MNERERIFKIIKGCLVLEKTAEKLRYLRLSSSTRKRSKRSSQVPSPNHLQSPVSSEPRHSTSSVSNATGKEKNHNEDS
jgi:hypothetical protein